MPITTLLKPPLRPAPQPLMTRPSDRPVAARHYQYDQSGFLAEDRIFAYLSAKGLKISHSTPEDDKRNDIDLYLDGPHGRRNISIKAQETGLKYGHVYFEIATQIRAGREWRPGDRALAEKLYGGGSLVGYEPAWFFTGKAEHYMILQGDDLSIYDKRTIRHILETQGAARCCGLSWAVLKGQSGRDSICAYLTKSDLKTIARFKLEPLPPKVKAA